MPAFKLTTPQRDLLLRLAERQNLDGIVVDASSRPARKLVDLGLASRGAVQRGVRILIITDEGSERAVAERSMLR